MQASRFVVVLAVLCGGCSDGRFPVVPASGKVLFNGKPLAGAHLLFQPIRQGTEFETGPESIALTDDEGRFSLSTIEPERKGAMVGKHRVSVTIPEEENRYGGGGGGDGGTPGFKGAPVYTLPERYRLGMALEIEVPSAGTDELEIVLTSP